MVPLVYLETKFNIVIHLLREIAVFSKCLKSNRSIILITIDYDLLKT